MTLRPTSTLPTSNSVQTELELGRDTQTVPEPVGDMPAESELEREKTGGLGFISRLISGWTASGSSSNGVQSSSGHGTNSLEFGLSSDQEEPSRYHGSEGHTSVQQNTTSETELCLHEEQSAASIAEREEDMVDEEEQATCGSTLDSDLVQTNNKSQTSKVCCV